MSAKSEALRLAEILEDGSRQFNAEAAAELRRLHIENEAFGLHLSERMKDLAKVEAQRDALLEALKGVLAWGTDENWKNAKAWCEKARAAIAKAEAQ